MLFVRGCHCFVASLEEGGSVVSEPRELRIRGTSVSENGSRSFGGKHEEQNMFLGTYQLTELNLRLFSALHHHPSAGQLQVLLWNVASPAF